MLLVEFSNSILYSSHFHDAGPLFVQLKEANKFFVPSLKFLPETILSIAIVKALVHKTRVPLVWCELSESHEPAIFKLPLVNGILVLVNCRAVTMLSPLVEFTA